jgi:hypothetical protein
MTRSRNIYINHFWNDFKQTIKYNTIKETFCLQAAKYPHGHYVQIAHHQGLYELHIVAKRTHNL